MCSQPIVQEAQLLRAVPRSSASSSAARAGRTVEGGRLEVAGGQGRERVERQQVGQRAELAVLRGGRAERPGPQVLGGGQHAGRVGRCHLGPRPHRHRLDVLGAEHRTEAAAAGVPAVVRERRVEHAALPRRADGGHLASARPNRSRTEHLGVRRRPADLAVGRLEPHVRAVDEQHAGPGGPADDDDRVVPGELARDGEVARRQRVGEHPGQGRLGHHGELRAGRERGPDQRGEDEGERCVRPERVDARRVPGR